MIAQQNIFFIFSVFPGLQSMKLLAASVFWRQVLGANDAKAFRRSSPVGTQA